RRPLRSSKSVSLTWKRSREELYGPRPALLDLGGLEAAWMLATVKRYPMSISPVDGARLRLAYAREDPSLGSDVSLGKLLVDARAFPRGLGENHVLALQLGGGTPFARPGSHARA